MVDSEQFARKSPLWLSSSLLVAAQLYILCLLVVMSTCDRKPSTPDNGRPCQGWPEAQLVEWEHAMADPAWEWAGVCTPEDDSWHSCDYQQPFPQSWQGTGICTSQIKWIESQPTYWCTCTCTHQLLSLCYKFQACYHAHNCIKVSDSLSHIPTGYASHIFVFCQGTRVWANHP